ncbi:hypothetical protein PSTG_13043 [Puccinia striiformis f. sp. tritici PST-78]|uniref:Uncharacterized protein n=1 Tax=Puccinia striiformis f. sp. tritici PST-78 TaxID=1165861 RepID=A0A0L0V3Q2_9BASI|nr:hypothetical protein PSTG_13043 [Puccinia striiformis f. sp. tritici PST-78]
MADFPGNTPSYIGPLFVASAKDLALLPAEAVQPNDMGPLPEEVPIITEDQAVNLGVQDDNDGREAMVRDGTPADAPPANDINLAAHEAARVALERQRPPSPFLPGQDPGSIRARNASSETTHEGGQANQIESPDKGQVSLKRQSREGDSDTDSSVDWGHFDDSADEDFIPHWHRASKPSRKRCARATTLSHNHLVGKIREPRDVTPPESDEERQSIEGPQDEEDDHSFEDCHSIEERESEEDCWSIEEDESDNLRQSKEERLLIKVHESDEDWESFEEDESDNQRQSNEERVLIEVSESDEDRESNEEGKSDREHESNEEHLQGNHGNSRFEEERQSTGVDHASRSRLPSAGESCMCHGVLEHQSLIDLFFIFNRTVCGTTFGRAPAPPILGPTRGGRASAARATRCLDNTRYIIANLPGVLGYKQPVAVPSESSMMKSAAKCFQRCKAENVLLGEDGDCFIGEQFVNRACLGSRKATGNARANNRGDAIDVLPNPDHPLFVMINSTSDPIRGSWTRLKNTIRDICGLMHGHRAVTLLDNLRGVNGSSDQALLAVHEYFEGITGGDDEDSAEPPVAAPGGSGEVGEGGIRYVFEFIASAISALVSLHMDQRTQDRQLLAQEDRAAQVQRSHTKSIACLSQLLILGPAGIFTSPRSQKYITEWQSCMLLEYGSLVVQERYRNAAAFPSPPWTHFGNTRLYIVDVLAEMGFGGNDRMDWTRVVSLFVNKFSQKKLAEVLWEDIVLMTDYEEQKHAEVVWAHSDPAVDRGN